MTVTDETLREVEWRDATSYSREDRGKVEPTTWSADLGAGVTISITCCHIYHKPKWVMHCHALAIDTAPLGFTSGDSLDLVKRAAIAKATAKATVRATEIAAILARLRKAMETPDAGE